MFVLVRKCAARIGAVLVLGALPVLPASSARADSTISSPLTTDFADPFVLRVGLDYLAFATGARGQNVQVARSRDLSSWTLLSDALPKLPAWAAQERGLTWAPSVLQRDR